MTRALLTYVEADIPRCSLTYGVAPCSAVLGVTGTKKCFNTPASCQVREDYTDAPVTLRWAQDTGNLPTDIEAIPSITNVSFTPATISLGEDLGQRATLNVTFKDHRDSDTGPAGDKYRAERPYDPFKQGTFFGRFRARQPYLRGRAIRLIRGELGQSLADMETRHFIIESFDGPTPDGTFSLIAKDALKMADSDRAQAPRLSNGFLVAGIAADATTASLSPAGIGNLEYPASGYVAIGGKEIAAFTRSGNTLTLTRGQYGTEAVAHDAQDRVQLCLRYLAQDPADIISDLFQTYALVPPEYIPLAAWKAETAAYLRRVYSALIAEPTGTDKLISELVEQCGLTIYWDDVAREIKLKVLRLIPTDAAVYDRENTMKDSLRIQEQPTKRISQVQTYFGQVNPLKKVDDADNYRSSALTVDLEAETDYGTPAIKRIFARWIAPGGRTVATRVNDIQLGRFRDPPRRFNLSLFRQAGGLVPVLGQGYRVEAQPLQLDTGEPDNVPIQITRLNPAGGKFDIEAEEMRFVSFDEEDLSERTIILDANMYNVNFRTMHDALYPTPVSGDEVDLIIESGVIIGSTSRSVAALVIGTWPAGVVLNVIVRGRVQGAGGRGGSGYGPTAGEAGGAAIYSRRAFSLTSASGAIWGGGGGGGGNELDSAQGYTGGGGGQGSMPGVGGAGNYPGYAGTPEAPGARRSPGLGIYGGRGGYAGQAGEAGNNAAGSSGAAGGAAGAAIDGVSYVTTIGSAGDRRGPQVN